jgi:hypothetical protein
VIPVHLVLLCVVAALGRKRKLVRPVHVIATSLASAIVAVWCFAGVASLL